MSDGRIMLGIAALISIGVFLNGWRFARMTSNPFAGRRIFGQSIEGSELPVERLRLIGRIQMIVAPLFLCLFAALCFGLLGPSNIQPIQF